MQASGSQVEPPANTTVNAFFGAGIPTFVTGTAGDDRADEGVAAQIDTVRGVLFPEAKVVADTEVGTDWPERPVVYGGAHVNALVAKLDLPFELTAGELEIGGETFEGDGYVLATVVPEEGDRPEMAILGGTATPGVAGINAGLPGGYPIAIMDVFGLLRTGKWVREADGTLAAELSSPARRLPWRDEARGSATIRFLKEHPREDEAALADACERGLRTVAEKIGIDAPAPVSVYVYPDGGSKKALTGDAGSGHAVVAMRALHMVPADSGEGGALEKLMAHEGTHVLAYEHFGPERTPFLAEGLAVWVADRYGGRSLADWKEDLRGRVNATPEVLLGPEFRKMPEAGTYPVAGLFVGAVIEKVGVDAFGEHLFGATAETWAGACERAGTSAEQMQALFTELFAD